jgi:hypothetical protein
MGSTVVLIAKNELVSSVYLKRIMKRNDIDFKNVVLTAKT